MKEQTESFNKNDHVDDLTEFKPLLTHEKMVRRLLTEPTVLSRLVVYITVFHPNNNRDMKEVLLKLSHEMFRSC